MVKRDNQISKTSFLVESVKSLKINAFLKNTHGEQDRPVAKAVGDKLERNSRGRETICAFSTNLNFSHTERLLSLFFVIPEQAPPKSCDDWAHCQFRSTSVIDSLDFQLATRVPAGILCAA